jgi:hypothetical protein
LKVPEADGVLLIEMVFEVQEAVTPAGRPVAEPTPVAPVVVWVRRVNAVFTHKVGIPDAADTVLGTTVLEGTIVIVPVADAVPQPPVRGMS